jgi:hypothetical protein
MDVYLAAVLSGFIGVVVGGLITYLTARKLETQKWEQQKKDKLLQDRREAIVQMMDWIDPIHIEMLGAMLVASVKWPPGAPGEDDWPGVTDGIAELHIRAPKRYLLPPGLYEMADPIIVKVEELRKLAREYGKLARFAMSEGVQNWNDPERDKVAAQVLDMQVRLLEETTQLMGLAKDFEKRLEQEFRDTYS